MKPKHELLSRAALALLALLSLLPNAFSQASPAVSSLPIQIIYTGKFLGYLRVPSLQSKHVDPSMVGRCPDISYQDSPAAIALLTASDGWRTEFDGSIRVSTGDNFAPQIESRVFEISQSRNTEYKPGNKELYDWWNGDWVRAKDLPPDQQELLAKQKALGFATIPTDNVACFLAAAKYTAVVPGKHDFYFGAERVRQLARFMAGIDERAQPGFKPVQMLGANLVIKTTQVNPPPSSSKTKSKWPDESSVQDLRDGKAVYPWFANAVRLKVPGPELEKVQVDLKTWFDNHPSPKRVDVEVFLRTMVDTSGGDEKDEWTKLRDAVKHFAQVSICQANDFNEITVADCNNGRKVEEQEIKGDETGVVYSVKIPRDFSLPRGRNGHYLTFEPGKNYGLCERDASQTGLDQIEKNCLTFPVFRPFFNFPRAVGLTGTNFTDPDPFVLLANKVDRTHDVAIFGAVDPTIGEEVGLLNFSWANEDSRVKSVVSAEDPGEALKQQFEYFKQWYKETQGTDFSGLSILLAQMTPQRAKVLATRVPNFQVVVTEADEEQGTSETTLTTVWESGRPAGTFIAVPLPYYDSKSAGQKVEGTVHLGMIRASSAGKSWNLSGTLLKNLKVKETNSPATQFWKTVESTFGDCLPDDFSLKFDKHADRLRWLTLCAIRQRLGADVALLQKRDFFSGPNEAGMTPDDYQQVLDRLIWKGDLLTLMYVPGSALKKALDQSKKFDSEDLSPLLANEKQRGLEILGIRKTEKDYLINEAPLDETKKYAVATSDYIGVGDTGYPDLTAAALDPRTRPDQFPAQLEPISGVVCRKLFAADYRQHCLAEIPRHTYLDEIELSATPVSHPRSFASKFWNIFPFKFPARTEEPKTTADALQQEAQQRSIWMLSLKNLSVSFNGLSNNLSDADIAKEFGGVTTSGVTAKKTQTIATSLDLRLSRSAHDGELFAATGFDFKRQSVGDLTPKISQINNRLTEEAGFVLNLLGGRSERRTGASFSLYAETQLQRPFTNFTLGTGDQLKITQDRSVMLLPRAGLRWQNGLNTFEGGLEAGREVRALVGYRFVTRDVTVECLPDATVTFADCIKTLSKPPIVSITTGSQSEAILQNRPRAGFYWKTNLSVAFNKSIKYELAQSADFFFNFSHDNSTDIRYRDQSKHSIKFAVLPNFSIGPSLRLLLYQNKVNKTFLFQKEFGFETTFVFDLFNRREKVVQIKHKP